LLTVEVSPAGGGTVKVDNDTVSSTIILTFAAGASVRLEAAAGPGFNFEGWSGALSGNENPATIIMDCNKKATARFSGVAYTLTINVDGKGNTSPSGSLSYARGTEVSVAAAAAAGWRFGGWTGDATDRRSATTVITMDSDKTIVASFYRAETRWWLLSGAATAVVVAGIIWLAVRARRI